MRRTVAYSLCGVLTVALSIAVAGFAYCRTATSAVSRLKALGGEIFVDPANRDTPAILYDVERALGNFSRFDRVMGVRVAGDQFGDEEFALIGGFDRLEQLYVSNCKATEAGWNSLRNLKKLRHIEIHGACVSDESLCFLSTTTSISWLDIESDCTTGSFLDSLNCWQSLETVRIRSRAFSDKGVDRLRRGERLTGVYILDTSITDRSLKTLQELAGLEELTVRGTEFTPNGIETFRAGRPEVRMTILK